MWLARSLSLARGVLAVVLALCACAGSGAATGPARFGFDADTPGSSPAGLVLGGSSEGGPARWVVVADESAPSPPHVLEQQDPRGDEPRYSVMLAEGPVLRDVRVAVRVKPRTGRLDRSGGVVFRAQGDGDYYVVRANLLEKSVVLYSCVAGERTEIASFEQRLAVNRWHTLEAEAVGDRIVIRWNGKAVIDVRDETFPDAGRAGVWIKADSVTRFDDLVIAPAE